MLLGLAFFCYGFYNFFTSATRYQRELPAQITQRIQEQGYSTSCVEVRIEGRSHQHFMGYAEFANGEQRHITVAEQTGEWEFDDPLPLSLRRP